MSEGSCLTLHLVYGKSAAAFRLNRSMAAAGFSQPCSEDLKASISQSDRPLSGDPASPSARRLSELDVVIGVQQRPMRASDMQLRAGGRSALLLSGPARLWKPELTRPFVVSGIFHLLYVLRGPAHSQTLKCAVCAWNLL